ncbi:MAG: hypothetical protein JWM68_1634 [Verrucomicrobiales bacterium]|nr:hypothetical protein [Verrucomicrobiales bacterium]
MNFTIESRRSRWLWFLGGMTFAMLMASFITADKPNSCLVAHDVAGSPRVQKEERPLHIFARSHRGREILFSKTSKGDLWFQDAKGRERCIATNVESASFSPDGKKFAYANSSDELFIETIEGNQLAHLTGARDHSWRSDSAAVTFLAMVSSDYPDIQQTVVYDLNHSQATHLPSGE